MKKVALLIGLLVIAVSFSYAADAKSEAGAKALLFSAGGFNASSYSGYGIGMKYYLSNGLALVPVVKFNYSANEIKKTQPESVSSGGVWWKMAYTGPKDKVFSMGLDLAIEKVLVTKGPINCFAGLGGGFMMMSQKIDETTTGTGVVGGQSYTDQIVEKTERSWTNFGGHALLGFEYFFAENISLGGTYTLGLSMSSQGKNEMTITETITPLPVGMTQPPVVHDKYDRYNEMGIGFSSIGLKLGVYF